MGLTLEIMASNLSTGRRRSWARSDGERDDAVYLRMRIGASGSGEVGSATFAGAGGGGSAEEVDFEGHRALAFPDLLETLRALASRLRSMSTRLTPAAMHRTDRKSTRLNSSHMSISYAVFCLKKK